MGSFLSVKGGDGKGTFNCSETFLKKEELVHEYHSLYSGA